MQPQTLAASVPCNANFIQQGRLQPMTTKCSRSPSRLEIKRSCSALSVQLAAHAATHASCHCALQCKLDPSGRTSADTERKEQFAFDRLLTYRRAPQKSTVSDIMDYF
eukprot:TRINITY_DN8521_c0_g2_i5.p1 TRINITY_DN8521_c0_g2~~TRINITY_DN8521_c0_g2_i5.p1  ORF type:complete len:108 (+),score=2.12 TRINITY_DN8521_c0_g2_i5:57-380(+)